MPVVFNTPLAPPQAREPIAENPELFNEWLNLVDECLMQKMGKSQTKTVSGWTGLENALSNKGLFILGADNKQLTFCKPLSSAMGTAGIMDQIKDMMQASTEGRLFVRDNDTGMLMQLQTNDLNLDSCSIGLSEPADQVPGITGDVHTAAQVMTKPKSPSILTRFLALFSDKYAQEIRNYEAAKARYELFEQGIMAVEDPKPTEPAAAPELKGPKVVYEEEKHVLSPHEAINITNFFKSVTNHVAGCLDIKLKKGEQTTKAVNFPENYPISLTKEQIGILGVLSITDPTLTVKVSNNQLTSNPTKQYGKCVTALYKNELLPTSKSTTNGFLIGGLNKLGEALNDLANNKDYTKLAKIIADGLTENNKLLSKQESFSDLYTSCAEMGVKILNILNKNQPLKEAVMEQLGPETKEFDTARNAKALSDLRIKALEHKAHLTNQFSVRGNDTEQSHVAYGTNKEVAYLGLTSYIECKMKLKKFDLSTTEYGLPGKIDDLFNDLEISSVLINFRHDTDHREAMLNNPLKMGNLFTKAVNTLDLDKQNELQKALEIQHKREALNNEQNPMVSQPQ